MSVPTGWLGFLAEIKAKLCHHNVSIVTEGCALLSRLLLCDVSVRVFIDSDVLSVLLDTLIGVCSRKQGLVNAAVTDNNNNTSGESSSTVVPWVDVYLATALFRALSDVANHAAALVTDVQPSDMSTFMTNPLELLAQVTKTDSIHRAVLSMLNTVTSVLTSWSTLSSFGRIVEAGILTLLTELVQIECKIRGVLNQVLQGGCDEACENSLNRNSPAKQVYSQGIAQFFMEVPHDSVTLRHLLLQSLKIVWNGTSVKNNHDQDVHNDDDVGCLLPKQSPYTLNSEEVMERIGGSRSHATFLENLAILDVTRMIVSLRGLNSAESTLLQSTDFRKCFLRFFGNAPANRVDAYLLERVLASLSKLLQEGVSFSIISDGFIDELLRSTGSLVPMIQQQHSGDSLNPIVPTLGILSFLVSAEEVATSSQISSIIKSGLFLAFVKILEPLQTSSSLLSDAPTITDGALSDEMYLAAALSHAKTLGCSSGVIALKMCTALLSNHAIHICENFYQEVIALQEQLTPMLARVLIRFPTMTIRQSPDNARPHPIRTRCCEMPSKSRTTRFSPLGECAAVCLDAVVRMKSADETHTCQMLIPFLPSIARSTARSIFPHLRGMHFRLLAHCVVSSGSLLSLVQSMPSAISAPVGILLSFNGCDDDLVSWEVSAAAEWISRVLRITIQDNHLQNFNLLETALPMKLLEITSSASKPHVKGVLLALTLGISKHQVQVSEGNSSYRSRVRNVVVPQTMASLGAWERIMETFMLHMAELTLDWGGGAKGGVVAGPRTPDAPHRLVGSMQAATAKLQCANNTLRCLSAYYAATKASEVNGNTSSVSSPMSQLLSHDFMKRVLAVVLACPTETTMRANMAVALGTDPMPWHPLNRAYESVLRSVCELFSQQYFPCETTVAFPKWPVEMFEKIGRLMQDQGISPGTRQCLPVLISSAIHAATPAHSEFLGGIGECSAHLFMSMLSLPRSRTATASQARLVSMFEAANVCAFQSRWVTVAVENLRSTLRQFREHRQNTMSEVQKLEIEGSLTIVASAFAFAECRPTAEYAPTLDAFARLLYVLLCGDCGSQWVLVALKLCRSISVSPAGREILATEVNSCPGDGSNRSCFSKLVQKTVGSNLTGRVSDGPTEAVTGAARARYNVHNTNEFVIGAECISTVVHKGGETFAQNLVKLHIVENIATYLQGMRRQRLKVPTSFIRLLAALSFAQCVQPVIFRQLELVSLLLEVGGELSEKGTLALLCLRNICFFHNCKVSVCQDGRFVMLLKDALLQRGAPAPGASVDEPTPAPLLQQRALLALTAFTSLCHRNERAKSYVRSALAQPPVVTSAVLADQLGFGDSAGEDDRRLSTDLSRLLLSDTNLLSTPPSAGMHNKKTSLGGGSQDNMDGPSPRQNNSNKSVIETTLSLLEHLGAIAAT